jgi:hypothetical protein
MEIKLNWLNEGNNMGDFLKTRRVCDIPNDRVREYAISLLDETFSGSASAGGTETRLFEAFDWDMGEDTVEFRLWESIDTASSLGGLNEALKAMTKHIIAKGGGATPRDLGTGAVRNSDEGKIDYDGVLHPLVLKGFGEYMMRHTKLEDGSSRDSDNWQKGLVASNMIKSANRHFVDVWLHMRGCEGDATESYLNSLYACIFNLMGMVHQEVVLGENKNWKGKK